MREVLCERCRRRFRASECRRVVRDRDRYTVAYWFCRRCDAERRTALKRSNEEAARERMRRRTQELVDGVRETVEGDGEGTA